MNDTILLAGLIVATLLAAIEIVRVHDDLCAWSAFVGFGVLLLARVL